MEFLKLKSVTDKLIKYTPCVKSDDDYITVTEWINNEGYDIDINGENHISLSIDELEAINVLTKSLEYNFNDQK